jgi:hypothetical protein
MTAEQEQLLFLLGWERTLPPAPARPAMWFHPDLKGYWNKPPAIEVVKQTIKLYGN